MAIISKQAFSDKDFLRDWKPLYERDCFVNVDGGHPGSPMTGLNETIQVVDIAVTITSMKKSIPDADGFRLHLLRNIPVEVFAILCNLLLLKFRSIAIVNDFVSFFFIVLANRLEASLPRPQYQVCFKLLGVIPFIALKFHASDPNKTTWLSPP